MGTPPTVVKEDTQPSSGISQELQLDSDPQFYSNRNRQVPMGNSKVSGMAKPLLIPDFIDYGADPYDKQEIAFSNSTSVFVRTLKGKSKRNYVRLLLDHSKCKNYGLITQYEHSQR